MENYILLLLFIIGIGLVLIVIGSLARAVAKDFKALRANIDERFKSVYDNRASDNMHWSKRITEVDRQAQDDIKELNSLIYIHALIQQAILALGLQKNVRSRVEQGIEGCAMHMHKEGVLDELDMVIVDTILHGERGKDKPGKRTKRTVRTTKPRS